MRTRQTGRGVPDPGSPWDEIRPGLWLGGHFWKDPAGGIRAAVVGDEFDLVISLFMRPDHGPGPAVEHLVSELPDGPLTAEQLRSVQTLAVTAANAVSDHRSVLIRCHAGYNRSGLVAAQTLIELGHTSADAIALLRSRRSPSVLNNETFEQYLRTGLDIACLLTNLEPPR